MAIKKTDLDLLLKKIHSLFPSSEIKVEHNSLYGYQLVIDGKRPAGLKSFKDKAFEGYLNGFSDGIIFNK
jgi:hypothetical protein